MKADLKILVTGATGYVGGRLYPQLIEAGFTVRCMIRRVEVLERHLADCDEVVYGNVFDPESLHNALQGIDVAYYLIHSMSSENDFAEQDREAARNFGEAARDCGVSRIVYLGGLGDPDADLSPHLRSRQEVGKVLRESGVPVTEFRASIVIGSGSLSYEMIRCLVERLPVMVIPRWVSIEAQPIAIEDLLAYLKAASNDKSTENHVFEIGGADVVTYREIMNEYARHRGLNRTMIPIPFLTPYLSSLWLAVVTPLYARVGRILVDSIRNPTVVRDSKAREVFDIQPMGIREAIQRALQNEDSEYAQTAWSDALSSSGYPHKRHRRYGSRILDHQVIQVSCSAEDAFRPIQRIGGNTGWYYGNWLWSVRGHLDSLVGGVGLRRGRRDPNHLRAGDSIDWWRVEDIVPSQRLRLTAEMKVPGRAWLQFEVNEHDEGCTIHQTAIFDPLGIWGLLYWYALYPVHAFIFRGMIREIARSAEAQTNHSTAQ